MPHVSRRPALVGLVAATFGSGSAAGAEPPPPGQRPAAPGSETLASPGLLRGTVGPEGIESGSLGNDAAAQRRRNGEALQEALDRAAETRRFFELPPGRYEIDRQGGLAMRRGSLRWIGTRASQIVQFASNTPILHVGPSLDDRRGSVTGVVLDGARLEYATDQGDAPESNALQLNRIWMCRFENLELGDVFAGRGTRSARARIALRLRDSGPGSFVFSCSFRDIRARGFAQAGLFCDAAGTGNLFQNCYFTNNAGGRPTGRVRSADRNGATLDGIAFEGMTADPTGAMLRVVSGTGAGQLREVAGRTGSTLRVTEPWSVTPGPDAQVQLHMVQRASDAGIVLVRGEAGNQHDGVFDQCNVEWTAASSAIRLLAVRGLTFSGLHVEGVIQTGRGLIALQEGSAVELRGGAVYDCLLASARAPEAVAGAGLFAVSAGSSLGARSVWVESKDENRSGLPYAVLVPVTGTRLQRPASVELDLRMDAGRLQWAGLDTTAPASAGRGQSLVRWGAMWPQAEQARILGDADATVYWGEGGRLLLLRGLTQPRKLTLASGMVADRRFASFLAPGGASFRIVNESAQPVEVLAEAGRIGEVAPGRFLEVVEAPAPEAQKPASARAAAGPGEAAGWSVTAAGSLR